MIVSLLLSLARGRRRRLWASPTYLTVSPISHDFGTGTGSVEIVVDSSSDWTATGVPSDMALSATSGSSGETNVTLSRTGYDLDGTAVITFKNEDGDEATLSVTRERIYPVVLTNAVDSSEYYGFDTCEEAATYAKANTGINWELAINLTEVPDSCFQNITNLVSVTLEGVTSIGTSAFYRCTSLASVDLSGCTSLTSIGNYAFYDCTSIASVDLSACTSLTSIGDYAFYDCTSIASVDLSACTSLTSIGDYAFYNCTGLTGTLDLPASLTSIGTYVFASCTGLTSVDLSFCTGLTSIGTYAFASCTSLASVDLPDSLTSIGTSAFYRCSGLTSVDLPDSLTSIGNYAFYSCSGLTGSLAIPGSVTSIGTYAFAYCSGLDDDLSYGGTSDPGGSATGVFSNTSFTKCKVPSGYTGDTFCDLPVDRGAVASYFEFTDSSLWVDNVTLDAIQDITSNTNWELE